MSLFGTHAKKKNKKKIKILPGHSVSTLIDNSGIYNSDVTTGPPLPIDKWIDKPLLMCVNPICKKYIKTNYDKQIAIPLNTVFEFQSKIFKGIAITRAVDLPNTPKHYFKGRARKMDFTFQGEFKRRISFARLYTGQIFNKPFTKIPGQYLVATGLKLVKTLAPALKADVNSNSPHLISPLASAAQVFQISLKGKQLKLPLEPKEDVSYLNKNLFKNMTFTNRKKYFHNVDNLKKYYFEPGMIYTISCYSHMISPSGYSLHMAGMKWGIQQYIPAPMQIATVILPDNNTNTNTVTDDDASSLSSASNSNIETTPNPNINTNTNVNGVANPITNPNTNVNGTVNNIAPINNDNIETLGAEQLQCEMKEEDIEFDESGDDMNKCEFLVNFQLWHTKLVDELYHHHHKKKKSSGFGSFFS